jgi:hypothetical protein
MQSVDYKILLGVLTILIGVVSYSFYFRDLLRGRTKPDAFSWLIWGVLASVIFFAQSAKDGGPGTWATAFTAVVCFLIAATAFFRGKSRLKTIDTLSLIAAAVGVALWYYTNNPLFTVLLSVGIGAVGFVPTFRKAFDRPREETAITYFLNGLKFLIAILALDSFTLVTWLYPAALVFLNMSLAAMLYWKKRSF